MTDIRVPAARTCIGSIGLILFAMTAFSTQDVVVKIVAEQVSLWQLQFIRSLLTLWLLVMVVALMGRLPTLAPSAWFWPLLRAVFMCGSYLSYYAALPLLPLLIVLAAIDLTKLGLPPALAQSEQISFYRIILIVALVGWTTVARLVRGATLSLKEREFVMAA